MKIGVKFNQLTYREYIYILDRYRKYTDFNTLALYRSITENDKLDLDQKIAIRDLAHQKFFKFFEFLQVKDPHTYISVSTLGETLTKIAKYQLWDKVEKNKEKILKSKRIKHRNFGVASKHNQPEWGFSPSYTPCPYHGTMVRQDRSNNPHLEAGGQPSSPGRIDWNTLNTKYQSAKRRAAEKRFLRDKKMDPENELIIDREFDIYSEY
jgi:hypothetical protein